MEPDFGSGLGFDLEYFEFAMTVGYPGRDKSLVNRWKYTTGVCGRYKELKYFLTISTDVMMETVRRLHEFLGELCGELRADS